MKTKNIFHLDKVKMLAWALMCRMVKGMVTVMTKNNKKDMAEATIKEIRSRAPMMMEVSRKRMTTMIHMVILLMRR